MNRYQTQTPRAAFAIAAIVMSIATMAAFVAGPSAVEGGADSTVIARANRATPVTITPARIDVVATREAPVTLADASALIAVR